ncbi:MAG: signal peptidase I [Actinomycetota bacterium]
MSTTDAAVGTEADVHAAVIRSPSHWMRRLQHIVLQIASLALALAVLASITVLIVLPRATHATALTVLTGSMTPAIPVGSVVLVRPVDPRTLQVGDVATYVRRNGNGIESLTTHRIVEANGDTGTLIFKGDANRGPDPDPVELASVVGEVWFHVPYLGAIRDALQGTAGLTLLAILVLGGYATSQLWGAHQDRRRRKMLDLAPPAAVSVSCDRPLVVAMFDAARPGPEVLAQSWNGVLINETAKSVTVLIAPPAKDLDLLLSELQLSAPLSIRAFCENPTLLVTSRGNAEADQESNHCRSDHARA